MKLTDFALRTKAWATSLAVAGFALAAPLGAQNLVVNGGFETGSFSGWTQNGNTNFTTVQSTNCVPGMNPVHSGTYGTCLGPTNTNGYLLQQVLTTQAGHSYDINFWLQHLSTAIAPRAVFNVYWNGDLVYGSAGGMFAYADQDQIGVATFPGTQLAFEFREDPSYWNLDDISVTDLGVLPEPTSLTLLGTGLVGLAGFVRRRRGWI